MNPALQLTDLAPELLILIFSYLPAQDLYTCKLVSRVFSAVITNSVFLQYNIELHKAGAQDNRHSALIYSEKLDLLRRREKAWSNCTPNFHKVVPLTFSPGSVYDLSGDVYLLGDSTRQGLQYLRLPHSTEQIARWSTFHPDEAGFIVDFGLNLHEHDLIALVMAERTYQPPAPSSVLVRLSLRQFSTGNPHPLAKVPSILVAVSERQWSTPSINLEIVGKYLALVTTFYRNPTSRSVVSVYEWQTGKIVMEIDGNRESYAGVVFLSEEILLLPNAETPALEIWRIPLSGEDPPSAPLRKLALPRLLPSNILRFISCRAEPNPVGFNSSFKHSDRPFHYDPVESVILLHLRIHGIDLSSLFTIFVHRRSLLDILSSPTFADIENHKPIPWSEWAPPITFCMDLGGGVPSRWITTTCGQRFVVLEPEDDSDTSPIVVFDFNPYNVRKAERELKEDPDATRRNRDLDWHETFAEEISSCLPYVVTASPQRYRLDGVLMDESRILGLQTDDHGHINRVEIFHFE